MLSQIWGDYVENKEVIYPNKLTSKKWLRMSCSLEKPYVYSKPSRAHIAYIDDTSTAHYGKIELVAINIIVEDTILGKALDVSIAYDARWSYTDINKYVMYTINEPYIALVDVQNNLYVLRGTTGTKLLISTGVDKCAIIRGWKHITDPLLDQGLIVFYTKQGKLFSRSYLQQDTDTYIWADEEHYDIDMYIEDIQVYRTKDFRIAILCNNNSLSLSKMVLTDRVFPGQSIQDESLTFIKTQATGGIVSKAIEKVNEYVAEQIIITGTQSTASVINDTVSSLTGLYAVNNNGNSNILITSNIKYDTFDYTNKSSITVKDSQGTTYAILGISSNGNTLNLNVSDMGNSVGDITVTYNAGISNLRGYALKPFNVTFTPVGLIPSPPNPPNIVDAYNTGSEVIS